MDYAIHSSGGGVGGGGGVAPSGGRRHGRFRWAWHLRPTGVYKQPIHGNVVRHSRIGLGGFGRSMRQTREKGWMGSSAGPSLGVG